MRDYLASQVRSAPTAAHGRNVAREYLQARILGSLQRAGAMIPLAFHGGTALRFLYSIPRFSEDLDFALERPTDRYDFRSYLRTIQADLTLEGYNVDFKISDSRPVHSAFARFVGLLNELGLSPHRDEVLSVKIEVDTRPPAGATLATTVVRRHVVLQLQHHDPASLLAGKLHAILQRPYPKGRDMYDLFWYLADRQWPAPNLVMLNHALQQTGWDGVHLSTENWRDVVSQRLEKLDWSRLFADVRPFVEIGASPELLTHENVLRVLARQ